MPLSRYQFLLTAIVGLGLATPQIVATPFAQLDGAQYLRTRKAPRTFTLVGRLDAATPAQLDRARAALGAVLDRDLVGRQQPLVLRYQRRDASGAAQSEAARLVAVYAGGLEGSQDNLHAETVPITFTTYLPLILGEGGQGSAITVQTTVTNANRVLYRSAAGIWTNIGTGAGGVGTRVTDIRIAPNGDVWVVGSFTAMGGVAGADNVARWDGAAWNAVGVPPAAGGAVNLNRPAAFDASGNFYYTAGSSVYQWNGAAWATLGTVAGGGAALAGVIRAPNGDVIIFGDFTSVSAVAAIDIARYSMSAAAWQPLAGTLPGTSVQAAEYDTAGVLTVGGAGGTTSAVWRWSGSSWTEVGSTTPGGVYNIWPVPDGTLLIAGDYTSAGGVTLPDGVGILSGSTFIPINVDLPLAPRVTVVRAFLDGSMMLGYTTAGTATVPAVSASITNGGTARAYPTLVLKGPSSGTSRIYEIRNVTTQRSILLNYTINAGETARFVFEPANLSFTSDFQGDLTHTILPGSNESDFFLQPGVNSLSFFAAGATVTAIVTWRPAYAALADLTR